MSNRIRRRALAASAIAGLSALAALPAAAAPPPTSTGPSTTVSPYVLPSAPGVSIQSLLTVGDQPTTNGYQMVGIPDGLGASSNGTKVDLLLSHELRANAGIVRAHGQEGAFVSKLTLDRATGEVLAGEDFIKTVKYFNFGTYSDDLGTYQSTPAGTDDARFARFCSATLSAQAQFWNPTTKRGIHTRIYFANEENNNESRTFGVDRFGNATELPRLGRFPWENTVPAFNTSDTTLIMGNEDGGTTTSELWAYVGTKEAGVKKTEFERAGLQNGADHVIAVSDGASGTIASDAAFRAAYDKGNQVRFSLADVPWDATGATQNAIADTAGTSFDRIEDGHWDPKNKNVYYFVTTQGGEGTGEGGGGGLWKMTYDDVENPDAGGTLELLLDGSEAITLNKPDNLVIDRNGNLLIQEDPGGVAALARIVAYRLSDGALGEVATFDPALFDPASPTFLTNDEESSGIVDASLVGYRRGTFLFDAQVHTGAGLPADPNPAADNPGTVDELVERGQLLRLDVADFNKVYDIFPAPAS